MTRDEVTKGKKPKAPVFTRPSVFTQLRRGKPARQEMLKQRRKKAQKAQTYTLAIGHRRSAIALRAQVDSSVNHTGTNLQERTE